MTTSQNHTGPTTHDLATISTLNALLPLKLSRDHCPCVPWHMTTYGAVCPSLPQQITNAIFCLVDTENDVTGPYDGLRRVSVFFQCNFAGPCVPYAGTLVL